MTHRPRVDRLETSLTPTGIVLRWLDEAHAYGSLESYVASILDLPGDQQPIDRLCREASEAARARLRGRPKEKVQAAVRSDLRETVFRYLLVLRIYGTTHDLLDREALVDAALSAHVALLTTKGRAERQRDPTYAERFATYRDLLALRVGELRALEQARSIVEERYLDGHHALFPDVAAAWEEQAKDTQALADMTARLAELDGVPPAEPPDPDPPSRRMASLVAHLGEPAKADALEKLGGSRQALGIAASWVRAKLASKTARSSDVAAPDAP